MLNKNNRHGILKSPTDANRLENDQIESAATPEERLAYTVPQAGRLLGLYRNSAYEAARRGEIPTLRIGRRLVVPRAALDHLLANPMVRAERATSGTEGVHLGRESSGQPPADAMRHRFQTAH